jgi:hypothetical protein
MAKPSVDGLEQDLKDQLDFTRVNINDERGSALASKYGIRAVPTFLVVSPSGDVLYRKVGGRPDREAIEAKLASHRSAN